MIVAMSNLHRPKKASPTDWHPADVIAAVRKSGSSLRQLSLAAGLHPRSLNRALVQSWFPAQQIIANQIGVTPQSIWPSRYEADGSRKRGLRGNKHQQAKSSKVAGRVNGKNAGAQ